MCLRKGARWREKVARKEGVREKVSEKRWQEKGVREKVSEKRCPRKGVREKVARNKVATEKVKYKKRWSEKVSKGCNYNLLKPLLSTRVWPEKLAGKA